MKKFLSLVLAVLMLLGAVPALAVHDVPYYEITSDVLDLPVVAAASEPIRLEVYSQLANYNGVQTGWSATLLKDLFNVEVVIIPDSDGTYETRMAEGNLGDLVVWGSNGDMPINRPVPCLPGVFKYGNPQNRIHLTEKPLQLMRDVVKITEPGGRILDPFAGSGTTVLAAVLEGYTATGIEVTDAYAALARERIGQELSALSA